MNLRWMTWALVALSLSACGSDDERAPPPPAAADAPAPTVFDDQLKAMDKAEAVEDQMIEQQQAQDQAMRDQGG
jgi:hypothetical protein